MSENDTVSPDEIHDRLVAQGDVEDFGNKDKAPVEDAPADSSSLPDDVEKLKGEIAKLRKENGAARTNAKAKAADEARAELTQQLGKALGFVEDETPVDPAEIARQIETEKAGHRTTQVELAVYKAAGLAGADPSALLDSRSFLGTLDDVDPSDSDAVVAAIGAAVEANPRLGVEKPSRLPAPNPAQGSSAGGAPSISDQIADAEKRGDTAAAIALKAQKLADYKANQK